MTELRTFRLPEIVTGSDDDVELGRRLIAVWQADGILQIATDAGQDRATEDTMAASRRFFHGLSLAEKSRLVSDLTYVGYIASGEEVTDGVADYSEIFTVCKDGPLDDSRVVDRWPCHGPVPWPDAEYRDAMQNFMAMLGNAGERILRLTALGFGLEIDAFTRLTVDGWHHMRVLRFPTRSETIDRGIGAPPTTACWCWPRRTTSAVSTCARRSRVRNGRATGCRTGRRPVASRTRTAGTSPSRSSTSSPCSPATSCSSSPAARCCPHRTRVLLNTRERFTMAYFHEPNFEAMVRPLDDPHSDDVIHYGTHFTNMFMRCYPDRVTTRRILEEDRLTVLSEVRSGVRHS